MAGEFCGVAGTPAASKGWGCVTNCRESGKGDEIRDLVVVLSISGPKYFFFWLN